MAGYITRRLIMLVPILFLISLVSCLIIELPPGDWASYYIENLRSSGIELSQEEADRLTRQYGLDQPVYVRYVNWVKNIVLEGDLGWSFQWQKPVNELLKERVPLTVFVSLLALLFSWAVAIPIGIFSATHQYSVWDYIFTFVGFIGLATPGFLLALVLAWALYVFFDFPVMGLFSTQFVDAPWSWAKFVDMLKHIWLPMILVGLANTGGTIRVMRGNLLDELRKPYVITAKAKGLTGWHLLFRYPVRVAVNPMISTIGWVLPGIVSGEILVAIVLSLQTTGPLLIRAVLAQDMYLAGSIVMILSTLTVIGTLLSDILLAWMDPRIRYERVEK